jgi:hypothetical protein
MPPIASDTTGSSGQTLRRCRFQYHEDLVPLRSGPQPGHDLCSVAAAQLAVSRLAVAAAKVKLAGYTLANLSCSHGYG